MQYGGGPYVSNNGYLNSTVNIYTKISDFFTMET